YIYIYKDNALRILQINADVTVPYAPGVVCIRVATEYFNAGVAVVCLKCLMQIPRGKTVRIRRLVIKNPHIKTPNCIVGQKAERAISRRNTYSACGAG